MRALYTFYDEEARNGKSSVFFTKVRSAGIVFVAAHSGAPMVSVTVWPPDEKCPLLITLALKRSDFTFFLLFPFFLPRAAPPQVQASRGTKGTTLNFVGKRHLARLLCETDISRETQRARREVRIL